MKALLLYMVWSTMKLYIIFVATAAYIFNFYFCHNFMLFQDEESMMKNQSMVKINVPHDLCEIQSVSHQSCTGNLGPTDENQVVWQSCCSRVMYKGKPTKLLYDKYFNCQKKIASRQLNNCSFEFMKDENIRSVWVIKQRVIAWIKRYTIILNVIE
jgi:hypothetical protein